MRDEKLTSRQLMVYKEDLSDSITKYGQDILVEFEINDKIDKLLEE